MKLSQFTDFGLRISMYLAQKQQVNPTTTITELSEQFGLSRNHLVKVVQFLSGKGVIAAQRGRGGGLRLGGQATHIKIGQLVQLLEQNQGLINCQTQHCLLNGSCLLKDVLDEAYQELISFLDNYSLQDMIGGKTGAILKQVVETLPLLTDIAETTKPEHTPANS